MGASFISQFNFLVESGVLDRLWSFLNFSPWDRQPVEMISCPTPVIFLVLNIELPFHIAIEVLLDLHAIDICCDYITDHPAACIIPAMSFTEEFNCSFMT